MHELYTRNMLFEQKDKAERCKKEQKTLHNFVLLNNLKL